MLWRLPSPKLIKKTAAQPHKCDGPDENHNLRFESPTIGRVVTDSASEIEIHICAARGNAGGRASNRGCKLRGTVEDSQSPAGIRRCLLISPEHVLRATNEVIGLGAAAGLKAEGCDLAAAEWNVRKLSESENLVIDGCANASTEGSMCADAGNKSHMACRFDSPFFHVLTECNRR